MYMITKMTDGRWCGTYQIQDGTERFQEFTRQGAIRKMVACVKIMNHLDITEADMEFRQEKERVKGISVTPAMARLQTVDVLINAMDDLHLANLKLRVALDAIMRCTSNEHTSQLYECHRIAKEALQ